MYEPVRTLSATVWRNTSTPRTSAMLYEKKRLDQIKSNQIKSTKQAKLERVLGARLGVPYISSVSLSKSG